MYDSPKKVLIQTEKAKQIKSLNTINFKKNLLNNKFSPRIVENQIELVYYQNTISYAKLIKKMIKNFFNNINNK